MTEIGITYVRLSSGGTVVSVPNSQVLNAVVGPVPPPPEPDAADRKPLTPPSLPRARMASPLRRATRTRGKIPEARG